MDIIDLAANSMSIFVSNCLHIVLKLDWSAVWPKPILIIKIVSQRAVIDFRVEKTLHCMFWKLHDLKTLINCNLHVHTNFVIKLNAL
jgi:hypothetical protein